MNFSGHDNHVEQNSNTNTTNIFIHSITDLPPEMNEWKDKFAAILREVPRPTYSLEPLIQQLVAFLSPAKIYLLKKVGVSPSQVDAYTDLLLIMPDDRQIPFTELMPLLEFAYTKHRRVCCSLHSIGAVNEAMRKGHIFYSLHCTTENLVYDDKRLALPKIAQDTLLTMKQEVMEKFVAGFDKALSFYLSADVLQRKKPSPIILFFLHQTVEFVYRTILQTLNGYDKRTHHIRALQPLVRRCAPQLNAIFPDNTESEKRLLTLLEDAYINARYDSDYPVDNNDLFLLFNKAKLLQASAKEAVEDTIGCLVQIPAIKSSGID